ncbi:MAG: glycosyltransferase family 2 protein [Acidobacteria bacterium]|nr:glycosyltransferase family 2 protein [Acidobacteriota bacterium]
MADSVSSIKYLKTAASLAFDALREGRLPLSPRRWLIDLRHLRSYMAGRAGIMEAPPPPQPEETAAAVRALVETCRSELVNFIGSGDELRFVEDDQPTVSVLLVLHNRAELTLRCLKRLRERLSVPFELVIVDNHSTDDTEVVLRRLCGVTVLPQSENLGFLRACNLAAHTARGTHLLFLNNDTEIQAGAVEAALETLESDASIGVVGGRLVFPDGRLQEAGSIIWSDGSCVGYGRGDWPEAPQYPYSRDVDYCSAAFMLTSRQLFRDLGGFDDRYQPAYYEDVDYCVRAWKANRACRLRTARHRPAHRVCKFLIGVRSDHDATRTSRRVRGRTSRLAGCPAAGVDDDQGCVDRP